MNITITKRFKLDISADDWELYDKPGRDLAARTLTLCLEEALNKGLSKSKVEDEMILAFRHYRDFGADDSEGYRMLEHVLGKAFND
jgi:hypothetical protein